MDPETAPATTSLASAGGRSAPPVLLVVFNRPGPTRQVIEALRQSRPRQVFVAADGPRPDRPGDARLVDEVRGVVDEIDWDCTVRRRYQAENVGLQDGMIGAISWFFDEVEAGVILEDDCVPAPAFLPMAGELLARYAETNEVMQVSGLNMAPERSFTEHSYLFAEVGHIWGWATWRRAWRLFDAELSTWPESRASFLADGSRLHRLLARKFDSARVGRKRTWTRAWAWTTVSHSGLATIPRANLIENVGFGGDATHPRSRHPLRLRAQGELTFPLDHPSVLAPDPAYERLLARYHRGPYGQRMQELAWSLRHGAA